MIAKKTSTKKTAKKSSSKKVATKKQLDALRKGREALKKKQAQAKKAVRKELAKTKKAVKKATSKIMSTARKRASKATSKQMTSLSKRLKKKGLAGSYPEELKECISDAKKVAKKDGYDQYIALDDDGSYSFGRNYQQYGIDDIDKFDRRIVAIVNVYYVGGGFVEIEVVKSKKMK